MRFSDGIKVNEIGKLKKLVEEFIKGHFWEKIIKIFQII